MRTIECLDHFPPLATIFKHFYHHPYAVFLDSSLSNEQNQYSILGLNPYLVLEKGEVFRINGQISEQSFHQFLSDYLNTHKEENDTTLPLLSGAMGYFSYDYGRKQMHVSSRHKDEKKIPDCILCFYDVFLIEDHQQKKLFLIANGKLKESKLQVKLLKEQMLYPPSTPREKDDKPSKMSYTAEASKEEYKKNINAMLQSIIKGDLYVVNLTQQLTISSSIQPYSLFENLRKNNPSPFGGYCNYIDFQLISSSPERFLQMKNHHVITRPIKGTRKRGATLEEDLSMKKELKNSLKDQSELLMIVDLERNDLNKVCIPGTVNVTALYEIEEYATVFHLVAQIEGDVLNDYSALDLFDATFPGGSITGAPKLSAMCRIDQVEKSSRNLYTGSLGYLSLNGDCDFNILIRTAIHQDQQYYLGVGGGLTYESDVDFEYEETLQKAKAILEAFTGKDSL